MKIALAQLNYKIGDIDGNTTRILEHIEKAKEGKADLVVFSELSLCGYTPNDLLTYDSFIEKCFKAVNKIAVQSDGIAVILGAPGLNIEPIGKRLYNTAYFLNNGKVEATVHKSLLPTYDVFDEYRHFQPAKHFQTILYKQKKISLTICEDLWGLTSHSLYVTCPMDELIQESPDVIVNIAASPFSYAQEETRKEILTRNARHYQLPLIYVNHVGAHTDLIFDGQSLVMNKKGQVIEELALFKEDFKIVDIEKASTLPCIEKPALPKIEKIYEGLTLGIRDYFQKMGFKKAVLGLSGGIDSAVVLALAVNALGSKNVRVLLMPSQFSSDHSVNDSVIMAEKLGVEYDTLKIESIYEQILNTLSPVFKDLPFNIAEENVQARIRGLLLMAVSNKFGNMLLNTSNKSELAVGYGTLYGDMAGGLSVIGDVYKTEVYDLARFINRETEIIPDDIITKAPSAELRHGQKDSDSLPEYHILDKILYEYIEMSKGPEDIKKLGFEEELIKKVLHLVNLNEYKRFQCAPVLRVSPKAFGIGRKMPIVAKFDV